MISAVNEFLDDLRGGKMTEAPIVTVEQGQLQGRVDNGPSGRAFYSFQGIPYAKPPLGSLRFRAPEPAENWEGVRDATSEGNVCAQINLFGQKEYVGDENCLFLNVYTPNLDGEFLPVMVYVHGGKFKCGSGNSSLHGADYLVEKDVVVVTINYRTGILGFLSLNTPEVPGNAGLKDIIQAIRWVKENIHNFGGNSGNLTVFGCSAGSAATSILTASPLSKGLINKAIMQSGVALSSRFFQEHPVDNARKFAMHLGCESEDVDDILEYLLATSVKELVEATERLSPSVSMFVPVVEKEFPNAEAVITEPFVDLLTSGRVADIPIVVGTNGLEFTFERTTDDLQIFIPKELNIDVNTETSIAIAEKIKSLYFKGSHVGVESLPEYFQLLSDSIINVDTYRYIQYLVKASSKPIYCYKFDYVGELNITKKQMESLGLKHAGHTDELGYLFKNARQKDLEPTPQDEKTRERMLRLWTNFAKSSNPTPEENHYITVTWLPVTKDNLYYLLISNELSLNSNPDHEKMEFWNNLYSKYYKIWEHPKSNLDEVRPKVESSVVDSVQVVDELKKESEEQNIEVVEDVVKPEENNVEEVDHEVKVVENIVRVVESEVKEEDPEVIGKTVVTEEVVHENGFQPAVNGNGVEKKPRTSNEIKMVQQSNGAPKDVIRANDPPEDDLPKNIGVNKFVNFFESLGGRK